MIFNIWRQYPKRYPKEAGYYLCTMKNKTMMILYYDRLDGEDKWIDMSRKNVFDGYKVYKAGREPLEYNRVYEDGLCERVDILAWKKIPKRYKIRR